MGELDGLKARQTAAAVAAARVWADHVLGEAQRLAPLDEGTLRGSGQVTEDVHAGGVDITISFSTPYAARQHEELDYQHPKGGQAKYLEEPFKRNLPRLAPVVSAAVAKAVHL